VDCGRGTAIGAREAVGGTGQNTKRKLASAGHTHWREWDGTCHKKRKCQGEIGTKSSVATTQLEAGPASQS